MSIPELLPLVRKVECLKDRVGGDEVYSRVVAAVAMATTPARGQCACSEIIGMCHPKAWGDRDVDGFGHEEWGQFLDELADIASACGQAIYVHSRHRPHQASGAPAEGEDPSSFNGDGGPRY